MVEAKPPQTLKCRDLSNYSMHLILELHCFAVIHKEVSSTKLNIIYGKSRLFLPRCLISNHSFQLKKKKQDKLGT